MAERHAARHPDRLALAGPKERLTWKQLLRRAESLAAGIQRYGLSPGECVCLRLPSSPIWVATFLALRRLGLTAISIGNRARPAELAALAARFDVRLVVADSALRELPVEVVNVADVQEATGRSTSRDHEAAMVHLTSGSSGVPKGVLRTAADLTEEACNVVETLAMAPGDAVLCATPVYHSFASGLLMACLYSGTPCLLMPRLAPATLLDLAAREGATIIAGVPYVFQTLSALRSQTRLPSLRLAISGGAHLPAETARLFQERFGAPLVQEYGLSEAGIVTLNLDGPAESVGPPIPNVGLRIVHPNDASCELPVGAEGEVVVRRASPPSQYLGDPEASRVVFTPEGVRSGDLGRLDPAGHLTLTGRIKQMINVAGAKVAPREVEEVLLGHAAVAEAVVFGIPRGDLEETAAAVVVPFKGAAVSEGALRAHCRERLSAYKIPAAIQVKAALPRTESGKPDLSSIRSEFNSGRQP
jgi:acyl-CoA synthetase (AMP-forming)/AMP-acid ligase II